jgi:hypothetical protein
LDEGLVRRTIVRVIKRYEDNGTIEYSKNSGPKPSVLTPRNLNKIKSEFINKPSLSLRNCSAKLNISPRSVIRAKKKLNIKTFKKQKTPKYINDQENRAEQACKRLYRKVVPSGGNKFVIMDDETYVQCDSSQIPGSEFYNVVEGVQIDKSIKIKQKEKFGKKFGVWQAIAQDGQVSKPYIFTGTMNGEIYLNKCVRPILIPFIQNYQQNNDVIFWPDLASYHYRSDVINEFKAKNIEIVSKIGNGPNTPQNRPIEKFWALCKSVIKRKAKIFTSLNSFRSVWTRVSKEVSEKSGKNLFSNFKKRLYQTGQNGVYSYLN